MKSGNRPDETWLKPKETPKSKSIPGQTTVVLVSALFIVHARVYDAADGYVDVVGADALQKVDDLATARSQVQFGERARVVDQSHGLASGAVLVAHVGEPVRFHQRVGVEDAVGRLGRHRVLIQIVVGGSFVAHHLTERSITFH